MWKKLWKGYKLPKQTDNSQYNEKMLCSQCFSKIIDWKFQCDLSNFR